MANPPKIIVGFFVVLTVILSGFVYISFKTFNGVITENAYQKGLKYNDVLKEAKIQKSYGYKGVIKTKFSKDNSVEVNYCLQDKHGKKISNAIVKGNFIRPSKSGSDVEVKFSQTQEGCYNSTIKLPMKGLWEFYVSSLNGDKKFQENKTIIIP